MLRKNLTNTNGFTFVETLVAIGLLALTFMGVLTMTVTHIQTNSFSKNHTAAVQLAEEAIERKLRENFDTVSGETNNYGTIPSYPNFRRTVTITTIDTDNKRITAAVSWKILHLNSKPIVLTIRRARQ